MGEAVSNSLPLNIVTVFIPVLFYFLGLSSNLEQFKRIFIEKITHLWFRHSTHFITTYRYINILNFK